MNLSGVSQEQPPTSAKVVILTTHGQLDLQLWAHEIPLACRNFIQLCLEGYYDNTIFHRVIPGFMIQGGDPSGTGHGGQSVYSKAFKDQFHQRLNFSKRGLLAMANSEKNNNGSQFFITFGECSHLNKKHTIFGKVVGNTIYNLMAMQSIDIGSDDRPNDPPYIRSTKVITKFFEDVIPRKIIGKNERTHDLTKAQIIEQKSNNTKIRKQKMKQLKKKNKLTFDLDEQEVQIANRIISSHDALQDQKLSKKRALTQEDLIAKKHAKEEEQKKVNEIKERVNEIKKEQTEEEKNLIEKIVNQQMQKKKKNYDIEGVPKINDQVLNYFQRYNPNTKKMQILWNKEEEEDLNKKKLKQTRQKQLEEYEKLKMNQLSFKKLQQGTMRQKTKNKISQNKVLLSNLQKRRYQFIKKNQNQNYSSSIFTKLQSFQQKLEEGPSWMQHKLKFHIDSQNAYKLQDKKKISYELQDLQDGGLKIQFGQETQHQDLNINDLMKIIKQQ